MRSRTVVCQLRAALWKLGGEHASASNSVPSGWTLAPAIQGGASVGATLGAAAKGALRPWQHEARAYSHFFASSRVCGTMPAGMVGLSTATGSATRTRAPSLWRAVRARLRDYKQLSKARLSALVVLTAAGGYVAGSGEAIDLAHMAWTCVGTFGAAACANALNQAYEVANDRRMSRTCNRPLPAGRLRVAHALLFAALTGAGGLYVLATKADPLAAQLAAANIFLYAGVYTPLKQLSIANTWVGAIVGAIPPLMGWASAAGSLEPGAWVLAAALFSWQMPHFLSLAWLCKDDYRRGGFRMLSMVDPTGRRTAAVALRHCAALLPIGAAAVVLGITTAPFAAEAAMLAAAMGAGAVSFARSATSVSARHLFKGSLLYLPLLLLGLAVHRLPNNHKLQTVADVRDLLHQRYGVWLPELPAVRLRTLGERLGPLVELRCPSRVYGDARSGVGDAQEHEDGAAVGEPQAGASGQQAGTNRHG